MQTKSIALALVVALVVVGLTAASFASGVLAASKTPPASHVLAKADLGVYSDSACTQGLASINWGTVSAGESVTRTLYVKNLGKTPLRLILSEKNWNPASANEPIALDWNLEGAALAVNQVETAALTLSMSSNASGFTTFNVDALISGEVVREKGIQ